MNKALGWDFRATDSKHHGRFSVDVLPKLSGRGKTIDEARANWDLDTDGIDFERLDEHSKGVDKLVAAGHTPLSR